MPSGTPGLVDIVRDFLEVDRALRGLLARYSSGELRWEEVEALFAGDEGSPLFRLKERCHGLFRETSDDSVRPRHREVLFDLAVGSLFHEAMKFRESFYQREVYGPRVRALRPEAGGETPALFREFEKIEAAVSERLEEGRAETEALLARSREQFAVLLREHAEEGHVARFLIESRDKVEAVFDGPLDGLLAQVYGDAAAGWALAGTSYLESGYYREAEQALAGAIERGGDAAELGLLIHYAQGMAAYHQGKYGASVERLERWAVGEGSHDGRLLERAQAAVGKIDQLVAGGEREQVVPLARELIGRLGDMRAAPDA